MVSLLRELLGQTFARTHGAPSWENLWQVPLYWVSHSYGSQCLSQTLLFLRPFFRVGICGGFSVRVMEHYKILRWTEVVLQCFCRWISEFMADLVNRASLGSIDYIHKETLSWKSLLVCYFFILKYSRELYTWLNMLWDRIKTLYRYLK